MKQEVVRITKADLKIVANVVPDKKRLTLFKKLASLSFDKTMEADLKLINAITEQMMETLALSNDDLVQSRKADAVMKYSTARESIQAKYQQDHHLVQLGSVRTVERILQEAGRVNNEEVIRFIETLVIDETFHI